MPFTLPEKKPVPLDTQHTNELTLIEWAIWIFLADRDCSFFDLGWQHALIEHVFTIRFKQWCQMVLNKAMEMRKRFQGDGFLCRRYRFAHSKFPFSCTRIMIEARVPGSVYQRSGHVREVFCGFELPFRYVID